MKNISNKYLIKYLFFSLILGGLLSSPLSGEEDNYYTEKIKVADKNLYVEIASTPLSRAYGLMYRDSMPDSCGMLFVFDTSEVQSFWMKETYIPLSIAFADENGVIVTIKDMEPKSLESVTSELPVLYALEVNKGWFEKKKIKTGDRIEF